MAGKVNKGQWFMLGMSSANGGSPQQQDPVEKQVLVIWKFYRISYITVGYNGGGNPNRHRLDAAKNFKTEEGANAYVEEIKKSSEETEWIVRTARERLR